MNLSNVGFSIVSASSSADNPRKNLQMNVSSHSELKKKIEAEDRKVTDALLDEMLNDPLLETSETSNKVESKQQESIIDKYNADGIPFCKLIDENVDSNPSRDVTLLNVDNVSPDQEQIVSESKNSSSKEYRCPEEEWSADEDSSSSSSDSSDSEMFFEAMREGPAPKKIMPIKTKGELDLDDLPPIEDLKISVSELEMEQIGKVFAIVDKLVVVRAYKNSKPLDIDSVLFLSCDKTLGRVFDVFGPVVEPFYSVRFNNNEHIKEKRVIVEAPVYYAPKKDEITSYVFVDQLQNQKGSDASWKDNNEPPEQFLDYSDDEQERSARRRRAARNRNQQINSSSDVDPKRQHFSEESVNVPEFMPQPRPASRQTTTFYPRPNPFLSPHPLISTPQPYLRSPSPYSIPRNHMAFPSPMPFPPPRPLHMQGTLVFPSYQQPVFGQVSMLGGPMSPALHAPRALQSPVLTTIQTIIPAHPLPPNYFVQRFPQSPSPGPVSPDPWLPNRAPYQQTHPLPPNAPLTVQIPPSSPSLPGHHMNGSVPQFIQNSYNQQQRSFPNSMNHPPYY